MVRSRIDRRKPRTRMIGTMLTSEEYQKLRKVSSANRRSIAAYIRRLVLEDLDQQTRGAEGVGQI